ncbi:MAG TPA: thiamine pyrophosphate-binding protein [Pseudolabrys sp.]|nr:thiamine pyrophosphate-binding protein [Pseudolabrys sp.]
MTYNSDVMADVLRRLGLRYVVVAPGSSFRGLHESLVNHLGNSAPEMVLALHEEHAVAIAHGYARVTEEPLAVIVHCNVGVMHASMAVYNAWCDRAPMLILGGTGPLDSERRRTPVDWLHAAADQGAILRNYTKWDDAPLSIKGTVESLLHGFQLATSAPKAPVYITLDQRLQEDQHEGFELPAAERFKPGISALPDPSAIEAAARLLAKAEFPVILCGRVSRSLDDWQRRIELAEALGAVVFSDFKVAASFPTEHPLHGPDPSIVFTGPDGVELLKRADVILSLDWWDQATLFKQCWPDGRVPAKVIRCSLDSYLHRGWTRDHLGLSPVDIDMLCAPDRAVPALIAGVTAAGGAALAERARERRAARAAQGRNIVRKRPLSNDPQAIGLWDIGAALKDALEGEAFSLVRAPLGWQASSLPIAHPLDYLGADGAAGIGGAPGMSVGSALALKGSGRIPVAVFGDGEFLMAPTALWTASSVEAPMIIIIANNRGYYIDEQHQAVTSTSRNRSKETAGVGQRMDSPEVDLTAIAKAQGFEAPSPVKKLADLSAAVREAVAGVKRGERHFIDVRITPDYLGFPH